MKTSLTLADIQLRMIKDAARGYESTQVLHTELTGEMSARLRKAGYTVTYFQSGFYNIGWSQK